MCCYGVAYGGCYGVAMVLLWFCYGVVMCLLGVVVFPMVLLGGCYGIARWLLLRC